MKGVVEILANIFRGQSTAIVVDAEYCHIAMRAVAIKLTQLREVETRWKPGKRCRQVANRLFAYMNKYDAIRKEWEIAI